ncbi:MAG: hypothetical protein RBR74_11340 [Ignavibacteriaceae bacterium]|jgi:hypothetical protein|nr:hypothetical protein [Ignavibacteriaceae bacterium]
MSLFNLKDRRLMKFTQDSDPICDLRIGPCGKLMEWLDKNDITPKGSDETLKICAEYGRSDFVELLYSQVKESSK